MECSFTKVFHDSDKDIIFIMELYKLHKNGKNSTRSSLGSKTQTLHVWNNYSKLVLKYDLGVLCELREKIRKFIKIISESCFWRI